MSITPPQKNNIMEAEQTKRLDDAIYAVANAVFYHYMDSTHKDRLYEALKELVEMVIYQVENNK